MANMELLVRTLSFIEDHLEDDLNTETIAKECYASKSSLEKTFKFSLNFSVRDYIIRRRMTKAARIMCQKPELSLLDIAVMYGYSSHEAFTRAFTQVWKCTPSEFKAGSKKRLSPLDLFPRITGIFQVQGEDFMRKAVDISELYDFIKARKDCWFISCDIASLVPINEISREAGDIAILESMRRMEKASGDEDLIFRIGGDEFVILTNSNDVEYAKSIQDKLFALNGKLLPYDKKDVPLNLYAVLRKNDFKALKYNELFDNLMIKMEEKQVRW